MEESVEYCDVCEDAVEELSSYCGSCNQSMCYDCVGWCCDNPSE